MMEPMGRAKPIKNETNEERIRKNRAMKNEANENKPIKQQYKITEPEGYYGS